MLQREGFTENAFEKGGHHVPTMEGESTADAFFVSYSRVDI